MAKAYDQNQNGHLNRKILCHEIFKQNHLRKNLGLCEQRVVAVLQVLPQKKHFGKKKWIGRMENHGESTSANTVFDA
jgi:predicted metal-dependent hydrolase